MFLAALLAVDPPAVVHGQEKPTITVTRQVKHAIDARLFGQFMERPSWSGEIGPEAALVPGTHQLRPRAEELIRQMRIPVLRFPGGTDVDYLDWTDMIDNAPGRKDPKRPISKPRGNQISNGFGYDEFLRLCDRHGSEAIVVVNFRDGLLKVRKLEDAARHAARLVAYCNAPIDANLPEGLAEWAKLRAKNGHPKPYGVRYFQIGNETWFFRAHAMMIAPKDTNGYWFRCLKAYVDAMRSVDPSIQIIVDGYPIQVAAMTHKHLGDAIAYFAVHRYHPGPIRQVRRNGKPVDVSTLSPEDIWKGWAACPTTGPDGQALLVDHALHRARRLGYKIALTEWNWNGWWATRGYKLDSLQARGIGAASFLHAMLRNGDVIRMANQSMLIGQGWPINAIRVDPNDKVPGYMFPSGLVTTMYSQHHGDKLLAVDIKNMPTYEQPYQFAGLGPAKRVATVDVLATRTQDALFVHMVNRRFKDEQEVVIDLKAFTRVGPKGRLHILEGRINNEAAPGEPLAPAALRSKDFKLPSRRFGLRLGPRTVTFAEIPLK